MGEAIYTKTKQQDRRVATYVKVKVSGFYSLNGEGVIEFPESNKAEDFVSFLRSKKGKGSKS